MMQGSFYIGGDGGIRTHVPLRTTAFRAFEGTVPRCAAECVFCAFHPAENSGISRLSAVFPWNPRGFPASARM